MPPSPTSPSSGSRGTLSHLQVFSPATGGPSGASTPPSAPTAWPRACAARAPLRRAGRRRRARRSASGGAWRRRLCGGWWGHRRVEEKRDGGAPQATVFGGVGVNPFASEVPGQMCAAKPYTTGACFSLKGIRSRHNPGSAAKTTCDHLSVVQTHGSYSGFRVDGTTPKMSLHGGPHKPPYVG